MKTTLVGGFLYIVLVIGLFAEFRPEPGSAQVPSHQEISPEVDDPSPAVSRPTEEEDPQATGFVRAWAAGLSLDGRYALGLVPAGQPIPEYPDEIVDGLVWLTRGVRAGDLRDYVEVPIGMYNMVVLQEDVEQFTAQDSEFKPPSWRGVKSKSLQPIRVTRNSTQTAVLFLGGDQSEVVALDDRFNQAGASRLRLLNFTDNRQGRLTLLSGGAEQTLATNLPSRQGEVKLPPGLRSVSYIGEWPGSKPDFMIRQFFDADHARSPAYTLVILTDRYGRVTGRMVRDKISVN